MSRFEVQNCKLSTVAPPLTLGIVAQSAGGKTCSALRLATGIKRVAPGPIVYIDTEGGRALEFKRQFDFEHMAFAEPYGSLDYVEALDEALKLKPSSVVLDQISHEHEGTGGYMDLALQELDRGVKEGSHWAKPSGHRRRLLSRLLTYPCSIILCVRAKPSLDWKALFKKQTKQPEDIGLMPIAGSEFVYLMTARFLLGTELPSSPMKGAPVWHSDLKGEIETMKLGPFAHIFQNRHQLCEDDGEAMARWALGGKAERPTLAPSVLVLLDDMKNAKRKDDLEQIREKIAGDDSFTAEETQKLEAALKKRAKQLEASA